MKLIKYVVKCCLLLLLLSLQSCLIWWSEFEYDNGKNWRKNGSIVRYGDIVEPQFRTSVSISEDKDEVTIGGLSKHNAPTWIKDTISNINNRRYIPMFPDGTILEKKTKI